MEGGDEEGRGATGGGEASHDGEAADETEAARDETRHGQHRVKLVESDPCREEGADGAGRRESLGLSVS